MNKLALACELSLNDWIATFPDVIPEAEYSKKHEKWKENLFNKMRDDRYHRLTTRTVKFLLVAVIICALLLTAFVIPSSREFILDNLNNFSRYKITENNKNSVKSEITVGYIPQGFELDSNINYSKQIINTYCNVNGEFFVIYKNSSAAEVDFNTEFSDLEEIIVGSQKYVYYRGNLDVDNIIWTCNDYVYRIDGALSKDELIKIAKTVE